MRFSELRIETRRQQPAHVKTAGRAWLIRAGYLGAQDVLTPLGERATARLHELSDQRSGSMETLGLTLVKAANSELMALDPTGDRPLLRCHVCGYVAAADAARARKSPVPPEPPLALERVATPDCSSIDALCAFLGIRPSRTAKAMLYEKAGEKRLVFIVVRGDMQLSERKLRDAIGPVQPASRAAIEDAGAVPGYASPIGLRDAVILADDVIPDSPNLVAGANEPGFHLRNTNYGRDYRASQILDLALGHPGDPCSVCGSPLEAAAGYLIQDSTGMMYTNTLMALAERHHDERGLALPLGAAPFDVHLLHVPGRESQSRTAAEEIYEVLKSNDVAVLFDDREERAGVKFNDADLIGCPLRLTVGERNLGDRMVELKLRSSSTSELVPILKISERVRSFIQPSK